MAQMSKPGSPSTIQLRQREADAAALAEARHHAARDPVIAQAPDRADQWIAVGCEGEGSVDDILDAGPAERWMMAKGALEIAGDLIEIGRQELGREIPRRRPSATTARHWVS